MNTEMNMQNNSYLLVDLAALRCNARTILKSLTPGTALIPVLKDDAYGLGLVPVARTLCNFPEIHTLAVSHVSEGLALRKAGIDREILVMGGAVPFQLDAAVQADLTLACGHSGFLGEVSTVADRLGKQAKVQIKIDTGLHRIGFEAHELEALADEIRECADRIRITGIFSHFSDFADAELSEKEYALFLQTLEVLEKNGVRVPMRHMACSASVECRPRFDLDAVRCGRRLYMDKPGVPTGEIRELASWRAFITQVKERRKGDRLGYRGAVTLDRDSLIATVGVGYGDGLNQDLFRVHGPVLVGGKRCRMLACCMDQCMVDVTGLAVHPGDEVTFFGYDAAGNLLSAQEVAALVNHDEGCGLTSALSPRVARVYIGGDVEAP